MLHANAALTPMARERLARLVVDDGWAPARAAERFQVSVGTARAWSARYAAGESMTDRSSRPHRSPNRASRKLEYRIVGVRFTRRWGPHRIAYYLRVSRSLVERVLARYKMPKLRDLDQTTGLPVRRRKPTRYERDAPGDLIHVDIKKQGRIPDGGGWRAHGRGSAADQASHAGRNRAHRAGAPSSRGFRYLHHAVDDHSRLAYSEILDDERKETAAEFWTRACAFFAEAGITVREVLTDNGSCYRSHAFRAALGENVKHRRTRPYRPQTNGKVERFNRTLATEWAYARTYRSEAERAAAYTEWLHHYNHHRPHTALKGATPAERVHNLTGNYN